MSGTSAERAAVRWLWMGPFLCGAALAAIGWGPTRSAAGREGLIGMLSAQALVLAVVYGTLAGTIRRVLQAPEAQRLQLALRAGVTRFLLTLPLAALFAWRSGLPAAPFLVWVAISYVVLVQAETVLLVRWMTTLGKGS